MGSFLFGVVVGAIGIVIVAYFVYRNNKKKLDQAIDILQDSSLTPAEKIAKIKGIWGV